MNGAEGHPPQSEYKARDSQAMGGDPHRALPGRKRQGVGKPYKLGVALHRLCASDKWAPQVFEGGSISYYGDLCCRNNMRRRAIYSNAFRS